MINIPLFTGVFGHSFRWFSRRISDPSTVHPGDTQMDVSKNRGTPKSSILIGCSIIFTSHFGVPLFLETARNRNLISGGICLLSKGGRCTNHWAQGVGLTQKMVGLLVGFFLDAFFFWVDDSMLDFFLDVLSFFLFWKVFDVSLMFWYLNWWFDAGFLCVFFWRVLSWWFLVIWCWICYDEFPWFWMIFWVDDLTLDSPDVSIWSFLTWWFDVGSFWRFIFPAVSAKTKKPAVHFFGWNERDRGNNLMMTLRQFNMISLVSWFWSSESIYLDSFWFDSRLFSERETTYSNWEISRFPQGKKKVTVPLSLATFFYTSLKHLKKFALDVKIAVRFRRCCKTLRSRTTGIWAFMAMREMSVPGAWVLASGYQGRFGWGSLGGKKINNTFFFVGKMAAKPNQNPYMCY